MATCRKYEVGKVGKHKTFEVYGPNGMILVWAEALEATQKKVKVRIKTPKTDRLYTKQMIIHWMKTFGKQKEKEDRE